jgi:hypothetical protein
MGLFIAAGPADDKPTGARPLREWLEEFGGYTGRVPDHDGNEHAVSLESWRGHDPDTTWITIGFRYDHGATPLES